MTAKCQVLRLPPILRRLPECQGSLGWRPCDGAWILLTVGAGPVFPTPSPCPGLSLFSCEREEVALGDWLAQVCCRHTQGPGPGLPAQGPLPLTRQLLSSSADRTMVPHFFPGTPLGEKTTECKARRDRDTPGCSPNHLPRPAPTSADLPGSPYKDRGLCDPGGEEVLLAGALPCEGPLGRAASTTEDLESQRVQTHPEASGPGVLKLSIQRPLLWAKDLVGWLPDLAPG